LHGQCPEVTFEHPEISLKHPEVPLKRLKESSPEHREVPLPYGEVGP
jgi:hypothetical protein